MTPIWRSSEKWLFSRGAIRGEQTESIERPHKYCQDLAHELPKFLIAPEIDVDAQLFLNALPALADIRKSWTRVEIDTGTFEDAGDITIGNVQIFRCRVPVSSSKPRGKA